MGKSLKCGVAQSVRRSLRMLPPATFSASSFRGTSVPKLLATFSSAEMASMRVSRKATPGPSSFFFWPARKSGITVLMAPAKTLNDTTGRLRDSQDAAVKSLQKASGSSCSAPFFHNFPSFVGYGRV